MPPSRHGFTARVSLSLPCFPDLLRVYPRKRSMLSSPLLLGKGPARLRDGIEARGSREQTVINRRLAVSQTTRRKEVRCDVRERTRRPLIASSSCLPRDCLATLGDLCCLCSKSPPSRPAIDSSAGGLSPWKHTLCLRAAPPSPAGPRFVAVWEPRPTGSAHRTDWQCVVDVPTGTKHSARPLQQLSPPLTHLCAKHLFCLSKASIAPVEASAKGPLKRATPPHGTAPTRTHTHPRAPAGDRRPPRRRPPRGCAGCLRRRRRRWRHRACARSRLPRRQRARFAPQERPSEERPAAARGARGPLLPRALAGELCARSHSSRAVILR